MERARNERCPNRLPSCLLARSPATVVAILPTAVEVASIAPSTAPTWAGVRIHRRSHRIHARCRIDWIFLKYQWRRLYNDRPANHDGLGHDRSLLDNGRRRCLVFVRFPLVASNFAMASYRQIGGHCRRCKSQCTCCTQDYFTHLRCPLVASSTVANSEGSAVTMDLKLSRGL